MRVVALDSETFLIRPGMLTPKLVCVSWCVQTTHETGLFARVEAIDFVKKLLLDPDVTIVTHNGVYDFGVFAAEDPSLLPLIFSAYESGKIRDTRIRQKLIDIAHGHHKFWYDHQDEKKIKTEYHLDKLVWRHFRTVLAKKDTWRLRYAELDGLPGDEYPTKAREYAISDAVWTLNVFEKQEDEVDDDKSPKFVPDEIFQTKSAWALQLEAIWGLRTDRERTFKLRDQLVGDIARVLEGDSSATGDDAEAEVRRLGLKKLGLVGKNGGRDMTAIRARIEHAYKSCEREDEIPHTPTGVISTAGEVLEAINDPQLNLLNSIGTDRHNLSTYVPILFGGIDVPLNPAYNSLVESGRTSCGKPDLHNPPRKGGVRECFIPRPRFLYAACDYDTMELCSFAQVCLDLLGESTMAEAIRKGEDIHSSFAAELMGISYEEFVRRLKEGDKVCESMRQVSKISNFGYPGGMAAETFVDYAKGYGIKIDLAFGLRLHENWHKKWPEARRYFRHISAVTEDVEGVIHQLYSERLRGGVSYCQAANGYFQGLTADAAKAGLWQISKECYVKNGSPLYGSRPVIFLHDENILEVPIGASPAVASSAAKRLQQVMVDEAQQYHPGVPIKASVVLMRRWYKGAKPVHDKAGNLIPSKPIVDERGNTRWVADDG